MSLESDRSMRRRLFAAILCCMLLGLALPAGAQESSTYRMERITVASGAATVTSASYVNSVVVGQESPHGLASACNDGFISGLGFWSILGHTSVPIVLRARHDPVDPATVLLDWTGSDGAFQVFRAFSPEDMLSPANLLLETGDCAAADDMTPASGIVYYRIVAGP